MPVFSPKTVTRDSGDGACGPFEALLFSDSGGLTQFGAFEEILPPGSSSSIAHWHSEEDEMVYILEGEATLHEGGATHVMTPGMAATFAAGSAVGHCLENRSDAPLRYLVIGTRAPHDRVTYPDHDRVLHVTRRSNERRWTHINGSPADPLYED